VLTPRSSHSCFHFASFARPLSGSYLTRSFWSVLKKYKHSNHGTPSLSFSDDEPPELSLSEVFLLYRSKPLVEDSFVTIRSFGVSNERCFVGSVRIVKTVCIKKYTRRSSASSLFPHCFPPGSFKSCVLSQ